MEHRDSLEFIVERRRELELMQIKLRFLGGRIGFSIT